jgi:hypothetical protein
VIKRPECVISEGLANLGFRFAPPAEAQSTCTSSCTSEPASPIAADAAANRRDAELTEALWARAACCRPIDGNAAILSHADGLTPRRASSTTCAMSARSAAVAEKRLEFIEHPSVADLRLRLRRGRGAPPTLARRGPGAERPRGSGGCSTSS